MNVRHGDLALLSTSKPDIKLGKGQFLIHGGSHGHPHSIINGKFYPQANGKNVLGYLKVNKDGYLTHTEHGLVVEGDSLKHAPLNAGWYEVRVQVEDTHEGMKQVVD